jgi:hypothetical protein
MMAKRQAPEHIGIQTLQAYAEVKQESFSAAISDRTLWPLPQDWDQLTWFGDAEHEMVVASRPFNIGDGVRFRMLHRADRTVEMALIIEEKQTIENIKDKWSELKGFVLSNPMHMDIEIGLLRWTYVRLYEAGVGQTKLAEQINEDILLALCLMVVEEQQKNRQYRGLGIAQTLMRAMEYRPKEMNDRLRDAWSLVKLGRLPWHIRQGPIDARRVKQMIDNYRAKTEPDETLIIWYSLIEGVRRDRTREFGGLWQEAKELREKCMFFG